MGDAFTLDTERFERVASIKGSDFYVALFFEQAKQIRSVLHELVDQNQADGWVAAAHKLKGASATLGFVSTAELLERIQHVNLSDTIAKQTAIEQLDAELARIKAYFAAT